MVWLIIGLVVGGLVGIKVGWEISGVSIQLQDDDLYADSDKWDQEAVEERLL